MKFNLKTNFSVSKKVMFIVMILVTATFCSRYLYACPLCHTLTGEVVRAGIFNESFLYRLFVILALYFAYSCLAILIIKVAMRHKYLIHQADMTKARSQGLLLGSILLGASLAGFFDGIVFHQILQTHAMFSNQLTERNLVNTEINMFWDGIFHAVNYLLLLISLVLLYKNIFYQPIQANKALIYAMIIIGFGSFNLFEGLVDHELLEFHHVLQWTSSNKQLLSDSLFLMVSLLICLFGAKIFYAAAVEV